MSRDTRIVAWFLAGIAALILAAAAVVTAAGSPVLALPFRVLCHGMPERSLTMFGAAMPLCARCVGIYAGLLAGIALFAVVPLRNVGMLRLLAVAAVVPLAIDGLTQAAGLRVSTNALRVATGLLAALPFAAWALAAVESGVRRRVTSL